VLLLLPVYAEYIDKISLDEIWQIFLQLATISNEQELVLSVRTLGFIKNKDMMG